MQSEIENIKNGVIVETPDYRENKRIIGIVQSTVQSVDGSIPPLSKQTAFNAENNTEMQEIVEQPSLNNSSSTYQGNNSSNDSMTMPQPLQVETTQEITPSMENTISTLEEPMQVSNPSVETTIPTLEDPIQVSNPSVLESLVGDVSSLGKQATNGLSNTIETLITSPEQPNEFNENIDLPKIEEPVIAEEPNELNNNLFATSELAKTSQESNLDKILEDDNDISKTKKNNYSEVLEEPKSVDNANDIISVIDAKKREISDKIAKYMMAASNMLVEEILELVKAEIEANKNKITQEMPSADKTPSEQNIQDGLNPFTLNL